MCTHYCKMGDLWKFLILIRFYDFFVCANKLCNKFNVVLNSPFSTCYVLSLNLITRNKRECFRLWHIESDISFICFRMEWQFSQFIHFYMVTLIFFPRNFFVLFFSRYKQIVLFFLLVWWFSTKKKISFYGWIT